jgi:hypothetical protein
LLDIQKSLGVDVDKRAALFINDVKGVARPKPAAATSTPPSTANSGNDILNALKKVTE